MNYVEGDDESEPIAERLALVASGRAEPLVDIALRGAPAEVIAEFRHVREAFASLALAEPAANPSASLRARILGTLAKEPPPQRRAILVVDMQNDHLAPGRPLEVPRARGIVPALSARLSEARRDKTPVIYILDQHERDDQDLDAWGAHNLRGTEGAEVWPALAPEVGDLVVAKPTYSAFTRSNLESVLADLRVDTLVLTGCLTEIGLLATATDALQRGYAVEVPADAQAGATQASEQMALGLMGLLVPYGPARAELRRARV